MGESFLKSTSLETPSQGATNLLFNIIIAENYMEMKIILD